MSVMISLSRQKPDFTLHSATSFAYDRVSLSPVDPDDGAVSILNVTAYERVGVPALS